MRSKSVAGHSVKIHGQGGSLFYKHLSFNLFHPIGHFPSFWPNLNLLQRLKTLSGFSGVLTLKERGRWICFKILVKSGFCLQGWMNFSTWMNQVHLEEENYDNSSVQLASSFQNYRLWHCFLQGSCWSLEMGNELPHLLLRANVRKVPRAHGPLKS